MIEARAPSQILALVAALAGLAVSAASGCGSDGSASDDAAATSAAGTGAAGGGGGGTTNSSSSGSGAPTTECFDWPAGGGGQGGGGAAGASGVGGAGGAPPCPWGSEVLMYLRTHTTCATYACLGMQGGQCCYEITPWMDCPPNAFPSFEECP